MQNTSIILPRYDLKTTAEGGPEDHYGEEFHLPRLRDESGTVQIAIINKAFITGLTTFRLLGRVSLDAQQVVLKEVVLAGISANHTLYFDVPLMAHVQVLIADARRTVSGNACAVTVYMTE